MGTVRHMPTEHLTRTDDNGRHIRAMWLAVGVHAKRSAQVLLPQQSRRHSPSDEPAILHPTTTRCSFRQSLLVESQSITRRVMASAPVKAIDQEGASPFRANVTRLKLKV